MSKFFDSSSNSIIIDSNDSLKPSPSSSSSSLHRFSTSWNIWHHHTYKPIVPLSQDENIESKQTPQEEIAQASEDQPQSSEQLGNSLPELISSATSRTMDSTEPESNDNPQPDDLDRYLQTTNVLSFPSTSTPNTSTSQIDSVEQMWQALSNLKKPAELPKGTDFLIFKEGIKPIWEDPINQKGGRWIFKFGRNANNRAYQDKSKLAKELKLKPKRVNLIWERLVMKLLSNNFIPESNLFKQFLDDDISGVVLSLKKAGDSISIWNQNLSLSKFESLEGSKAIELYKELQIEEEEEATETVTDEEEEEQDQVDEQEQDIGKSSTEEDEDIMRAKKQVKLTPFLLRRGISDAMFLVIREVDAILKAEEEIESGASNQTILKPFVLSTDQVELRDKKVHGVMTHYMLHQEPKPMNGSSFNHNGNNHHNHHNNHHNHINGHNHNGSNNGRSNGYTYNNSNNKKKSNYVKKDNINTTNSNNTSRRFNSGNSNNNKRYNKNDDESGNQYGGPHREGESRFKWSRDRESNNGSNNDEASSLLLSSSSSSTTTNTTANTSAAEGNSSTAPVNNMFAGLGKQRKKLEIDELSGKVVSELGGSDSFEVNNLLGSRRRLQQSKRK